MIQKKVLVWYTSIRCEYLDRVIIVKVCMDNCNTGTKVSIYILRIKIPRTKLVVFQHNIVSILNHISTQMSLIDELRETSNKLVKDTCNALLTASN